MKEPKLLQCAKRPEPVRLCFWDELLWICVLFALGFVVMYFAGGDELFLRMKPTKLKPPEPKPLEFSYSYAPVIVIGSGSPGEIRSRKTRGNCAEELSGFLKQNCHNTGEK